MLEDHAPLDTLIAPGLVTAATARLWMRCPHAGPCLLQLFDKESERCVAEGTFDNRVDRRSDFTTSFMLPADVPGLEPLKPNRDYTVRVVHRGTQKEIGTAAFRTSPLGVADTPENMVFAAMSCNQPFGDDGSASVEARSLAMLTPHRLRELDVSRVLLTGDQMYTDLPADHSLFDEDYFRKVAPNGRSSIFDCSRQEVREIIHRRYRHYWKFPELKELIGGWAGDMRPDDHEIVDNFGSAPEHATEKFANLRDGALDAFYDYQAKGMIPASPSVRPDAFDYSFEQGTIAYFATDLRSEKRNDGERIRMMSERQFTALEAFLNRSSDKHVVVIILSVPVLHVPDWLTTVATHIGGESSDAADRWSYAKATADRDRLLRLLLAHQGRNPRQRLVMIGGDVHIGLACEFIHQGAVRPLYQLVSSALSNKHSPLLQRLAEIAPSSRRHVCDLDDKPIEGALMSGTGKLTENPTGRLNFGTVHVRRVSAEESTVRLCLHSTREHGGMVEPTCVFDSGEQ